MRIRKIAKRRDAVAAVVTRVSAVAAGAGADLSFLDIGISAQARPRQSAGIKKAASMTKRPACNILSPLPVTWQAPLPKFVSVLFVFFLYPPPRLFASPFARSVVQSRASCKAAGAMSPSSTDPGPAAAWLIRFDAEAVDAAPTTTGGTHDTTIPDRRSLRGASCGCRLHHRPGEPHQHSCSEPQLPGHARRPGHESGRRRCWRLLRSLMLRRRRSWRGSTLVQIARPQCRSRAKPRPNAPRTEANRIEHLGPTCVE